METDGEDTCISRFARGYEVVSAEIRNEDKYNTYYYSLDKQGSTLFITDAEGQVANSYFYDAFGNVLNSEELVHNRITYVGQQYCLRARYYNPVIGSFTQEDNYRGDGLNLYAYCENNPIIYYDFSGYARKCKKSQTSNIYGLTADDIPTAKTGKFNEFFDSLTSEELDELWKDKSIRRKIERALRDLGGLHEWHMVSRTPTFKMWGVSAGQIKDLRSSSADVIFVSPAGKHGSLGSITVHNEILDIIDSSLDYDNFVRKLSNWAKYRLKNGISSLLKELQL